jgi:hypothetical protein
MNVNQDLPRNNRIRVSVRCKLTRSEWDKLVPALELALVEDAGPEQPAPQARTISTTWDQLKKLEAANKPSLQPRPVSDITRLTAGNPFQTEENPLLATDGTWFIAMVANKPTKVSLADVVGTIIMVRPDGELPGLKVPIKIEDVIEPHRAMVRQLVAAHPGARVKTNFDPLLGNSPAATGEKDAQGQQEEKESARGATGAVVPSSGLAAQCGDPQGQGKEPDGPQGMAPANGGGSDSGPAVHPPA